MTYHPSSILAIHRSNDIKRKSPIAKEDKYIIPIFNHFFFVFIGTHMTIGFSNTSTAFWDQNVRRVQLCYTSLFQIKMRNVFKSFTCLLFQIQINNVFDSFTRLIFQIKRYNVFNSFTFSEKKVKRTRLFYTFRFSDKSVKLCYMVKHLSQNGF